MLDKDVYRVAIAHHQMGLLHLEVLEKMAHAIAAIERATDDVVEAKS